MWRMVRVGARRILQQLNNQQKNCAVYVTSESQGMAQAPAQHSPSETPTACITPLVNLILYSLTLSQKVIQHITIT